MVLRSSVPWITRRCSSAAVSTSRRKLRMRDQRPTYPDGAYCVCKPPTRSSVCTSGKDERSSKYCRASNARLSSRVVRMRSGFFVSAAGRRRGNHGTRGCGIVRVEKDQIPAEQHEQWNIGSADGGTRLDLDRAARLDETMSPFEKDHRPIF